MFGELEGSFMNQVLGGFGQGPLVWLRRPTTVWIALFVLCLWRWTGVNMLLALLCVPGHFPFVFPCRFKGVTIKEADGKLKRSRDVNTGDMLTESHLVK